MTKTGMPNSEIIIYQTESGATKIEVRLQDETVWLTQKLMAELFQVGVNTINYHIKEIFDEGELSPNPTIRKFRIVQREGLRNVERLVDFYNLDMIISVGYRVKSHVATHFRKWATQRLREYIIKGFTLDDERLKNVQNIGSDYFDELLERIRDIRTSEQRFYHKIKEIYTLAVDYDPDTKETIAFFKTVQNKLHFAVTGHTAAEIVAKRADASKTNMGLTSWKGEKVRKPDVTIAKNYLNKEELEALNRIVTMYLDFAEDQAKRRKVMFMSDWRERLDSFLQLNDRNILIHAGKISHELAASKAEEEYEKYHVKRIAEKDNMDSDFDKTVNDHIKKIIESKKKSIQFFSNKMKPNRERWVVNELLDYLKLDRSQDEVKSSTDEPIDVVFREGSFQIKEIMDDNRKRGDEYKQQLIEAKNAKTPEELSEQYPSNPFKLEDALSVVKDQVNKWSNKYPSSIRKNLDLLFYLNLNNIYIEYKGEKLNMDNSYKFDQVGWRSITVVANDCAFVVYASEKAPNFIKNIIGRIFKKDYL